MSKGKFPALDQAEEALTAKRKELKDVFTEAGESVDLSQVKSVSGTNDDKLKWIREKNQEIADQKKAVEDYRQLYDIASEVHKDQGSSPNHEPGAQGTDPEPGGQMKSLGKQFVESAAYKNYEKGSGRSGVAKADVGAKTLFQTTAGHPPESVRSGVVVPDAQRPAPHVVDAIPSSPVNQEAYVYMEETTFTNNAAETAEASAFNEVQLALTEQSQTVRKITAWIPVTDEQLEDVDGVQTYLENRLQYMLRQRLDQQVLLGNGTAPNLLGTSNVSGIQTQNATGDTLIDASYKAFTGIRSTAFSEPSVLYVEPTDWQRVMLSKTADGSYIWGNPAVGGPESLWGVPVVNTTVLTAGTAITGDYTVHSLLGMRRGIDLQVTNAHSDFFVNGKQAIRADLRTVMVHYRPAAFAEITNIGS